MDSQQQQYLHHYLYLSASLILDHQLSCIQYKILQMRTDSGEFIIQRQERMETTTIIKISLMIAFFAEVVIFGKFISGLKCFGESDVMSLAMTFSGTLFLSIALLDIIPEAITNFDQYLSANNPHLSESNTLHSNSNLPLTMIIAMFTFMLIMYIDKILIGHSHDHEYDVSFTGEPKKSSVRDNVGVEMEEKVDDRRPLGTQHQEQTPTNWRPFILQAGMSIHAFFQCMAVGLQKTPLTVLGLASAILVHKWAEGLTLGLIYQKEGYSSRTINIMIIAQGLINVGGLGAGMVIAGMDNPFIMAFFMSISAGTFLYISLAEVLVEQLSGFNKRKAVSMMIANIFITGLVWFEKYQEEQSSHES